MPEVRVLAVLTECPFLAPFQAPPGMVMVRPHS